MAQSINDIQDEIKQDVEASGDLPAIDILTDSEVQQLGNVSSTSKVGILRNLIYVFAVAANRLQELWDVFRAEINELIAVSRPFTERWYRREALKFQIGYDLNPVTNAYDEPTTPTETDAVEASKIVKQAAVMPTVIANVGAIRMKVAKLMNGELGTLTEVELSSFQEYIEKIGAAGVYIVATSGQPDDLLLKYKIYFNPLLLDNQGRRLDGTADTPVQEAIKAYLRSSSFNSFNGKLSTAKLTDVVQQVEGVEDAFLQLAASKYGEFQYTDITTTGNVGPISDYRVADAGYFQMDETVSEFEFLPSE